jgi:hypothetical protein
MRQRLKEPHEVTVEDNLPQEWRDRAFRANSGELAWRREDAIGVVSLLAARDLAILGGEVWHVDRLGRIWGAIPLKDEGPATVFHWEVDPILDRETETWSQYCHRAAEYSVSTILEMHPENEVRPDLRSGLRYNLTCATREEYETLS